VNPNGQNQTWSRWIFTIYDGGRSVPYAEIEYNARKWLRKCFGSVGKTRVRRTLHGWVIEAIAEGAPVKDRFYVSSVRSRFQTTFVERGFGPLASSRVEGTLLAGNPENGSARSQWVEMPTIRIDEGAS